MSRFGGHRLDQWSESEAAKHPPEISRRIIIHGHVTSLPGRAASQPLFRLSLTYRVLDSLRLRTRTWARSFFDQVHRHAPFTSKDRNCRDGRPVQKPSVL